MLDGIKFLEEHKQEVVNAYVVYLDLIRAKELIVKKLANIRQIDTFVQNEQGDYDVTGEEGFVAVDLTGNAIKLVDRLDSVLKTLAQGASMSIMEVQRTKTSTICTEQLQESRLYRTTDGFKP